MNLYIRYFDHETLVNNAEDAISFLAGLNDFPIDKTMQPRIQSFYNSSNAYPFRLKVSYNNYVLFLKTEAVNLDQFHEFEKANKAKKANKEAKAAEAKAQENAGDNSEKPEFEQKSLDPLLRTDGMITMAERKKQILESLSAPNPGWYEGEISFKRVVPNPKNNKCQYIDSNFIARCKAESPQDCYDRLITYLKKHKEIDPRSQFPSVRNNNFKYRKID